MTLGTIYTFGYGKFKGPAELREFLEDAGVEGKIDVVVDIRFKPTGRNPLWRKGLVADTIQKAGIPQYQLVQELGNPDFATGRPASRLADEPTGMGVLLEHLQNGVNVALMCVCQETAHCHRRLIIAKARAVHPELQVVELEIGKQPVTS